MERNFGVGGGFCWLVVGIVGLTREKEEGGGGERGRENEALDRRLLI